jgi:hypothetical protein
MLCALAAFSLLPVSATLYRGASIPGSETRYWSCEDVSLDKRYPLRSNGQGLVLQAGKDKRALIRFGDLRRAIGPGQRIVSARLVVNVEQVAMPGRVELKRFSSPWHEGPGFGEGQPNPLQGSISWGFRFYDAKRPTSWKNGGAEFVAVTPSSSADGDLQSKEIVFDGIGSDVQAFYDRPYDNNGWSIEAAGDIAFTSAQAGKDGPRLELQYEPVQERTGADLSVTFISTSPEYLRYDNRGDAYTRVTVNGHESGVMMNPGNAASQKWPNEGEEVAYTAHIKNVGTAPSQGFSYNWYEQDKVAGQDSINRQIAPGETVTVSFKAKFRAQHNDHRNQPISIRVAPSGPDACEANNALRIEAAALNIGIWVDEGFYKKFAEKINGSGTRAFEDWIQWQFEIWNDVFMAHSRFSFAQDGSRERVRVGRVSIVPVGTLKGSAHLPNETPNLVFDGEWGFDSSFGDASGYIDSVRTQADRALLHEMSHQIGLIDLYQMNVDPSLPDGTQGKVRLKTNGFVMTRGAFDAFGGLMGGGDTRNESLVPRQLPIPPDTSYDPVYESPLFTPTDLYSMTDVGALNAGLGNRRGFYGEFLYAMPETVVLRVLDGGGKPIASGKLLVYQMKSGQINDEQPDFEVEIKNGAALLPNRPTGIDIPFKTATGFTLRPNPFGRTDVVGSNGVLLFRLDNAGTTEWAWLKAWQLSDSYFRGNKNVDAVALRFNIAHRTIKPSDWALRKTALDKSNSTASNLAKLLDGDPTTFYEASGEVGDWFEVDIGRDRPIGEIKFVMTGDHKAFWKRFDILIYGTGQTVTQARVYASEKDWQEAMTERRDINEKNPDVRSVAYRALPETVRFIRVVNRGGDKGRLAGIEIREAEPVQ